MVNILNEHYKKRDLLRYFGNYKVAIGCRSYTLRDGKSDQIKITEVKTGGGLRFEISESRGMDIGNCYYKEIPIAFCSYCDESHPCYHEAYDDEWLRSFSGGLLTCGGLVSMGSAENDNGELLPLHGRISNTPTQAFHVEEKWIDEELTFDLHGTIRESKALSYNLLLDRHIFVKAGENTITIRDEVHNEGFQNTEHMMLYHFNIGYPILDRDTKFYAKSKIVIPRDKVAKERIEPYDVYLGPTNNYPDTVYFHDIEEIDGYCKVALINHKRNLGVTLRYRKDTLDHFTQWKFTSEGNYVAGIEPCNARVCGRSVERNEGRLKSIEAQKSVTYELCIGILDGEKEIKRYLQEEAIR